MPGQVATEHALNAEALVQCVLGVIIVFVGEFVPSAGFAWNPANYFDYDALDHGRRPPVERGTFQRALYYLMGVGLIFSGTLTAVWMSGFYHTHTTVAWTTTTAILLIAPYPVASRLAPRARFADRTPAEKQAAKMALGFGTMLCSLGGVSLAILVAAAHSNPILPLLSGILMGPVWYTLADVRLGTERRTGLAAFSRLGFLLSWLLHMWAIATVPHGVASPAT